MSAASQTKASNAVCVWLKSWKRFGSSLQLWFAETNGWANEPLKASLICPMALLESQDGEATEGARGCAICRRNGAAEAGDDCACLKVMEPPCSLLMPAEKQRQELRLCLSLHSSEIVNCSRFLWMSAAEIPPQSKVVADLVTDDSRAKMKSFSKSFYSNTSNHQNNSPPGTMCTINILLFPDHFLSVEKYNLSACVVIS